MEFIKDKLSSCKSRLGKGALYFVAFMWFFKFAIVGILYLIGQYLLLQGACEAEPTSAPDNPKVLCMIFTTAGNWESKGHAVKNTWARRCDDFRFIYSFSPRERIDHPQAVPFDIREGREHLTAKTMQAFRTLYTNFTDKFDWYMKADDDSFIIMENLKHMLRQLDPNDPVYIGGRSMTLLENGYNGGGAGYLLSKEAVRLLLTEGAKNPHECKQDGAMEDLDVGNCLQYLEIYPLNTRDEFDRMTFHPDHPYKLFAGMGDAQQVYWYRRDSDGLLFGNPSTRDRMLSPHTVSFHYVDPAHMYMYEFLLYELQRHGPT